MSIIILGIESSCDDTSAAVLKDGILLTNSIANQDVHKKYGGVVPELASRAHQQNIIPVVDMALKAAKVNKSEISAIAFTRGPGLLGSLLVGTSFSKGLALSLDIPLIEVNHLQAHIIATYIREENIKPKTPGMPYLCLLVSGGHTQLVIVNDYLDMEIIGKTIDDAAGEAFDKCAKVLGFPYPGGPYIDKNAKLGNPGTYKFSKPKISKFDYSFSGLKTAFLYFIRDELKKNKDFINKNLYNLCASIQKTIIDILFDKLILAVEETGITEIAIAGGVSANEGLRNSLIIKALERKWNIFLPEFKYTTDNAAMIAQAGYYKYLAKKFVSQSIIPLARYNY